MQTRPVVDALNQVNKREPAGVPEGKARDTWIFTSREVALCLWTHLAFTVAQRAISAKDRLKKKKIIRNAYGDQNIG